ncbi:RDD family protein [Chitinolyticbacter meiyuanensis]|uniref:RDD family protein n=1 Tax=Chitinolyticbacter meiyuanensis TaxID=682798 RepID=UPI0011E5FA3A|nr:RDD family protein [Chitinolyticbacter meiyuanensis]
MTALQPAGWWRRFFAWWYELLLLIPVLLLLAIPPVAAQALVQLVLGSKVDGSIDTPLAHALNFAWFITASFGYFAWCWLRSGQTLAMKTWRLRLVDAQGHTPRLSQMLGRFGLATLCYLPLLPLWMLARRDPQWIPYAWLALAWFIAPFFWAIVDRERLLLHDRFAGTRLVLAPTKAKQQQAAGQQESPVT